MLQAMQYSHKKKNAKTQLFQVAVSFTNPWGKEKSSCQISCFLGCLRGRERGCFWRCGLALE